MGAQTIESATVEVVPQAGAASLDSPYPALDVSPDDALVVTSGMRGQMRLFDIGTRRIVRQLGWSTQQYRDAVFDSEGETVAAISAPQIGDVYTDYNTSPGYLEFWNPRTGTPAFSGEAYDKTFAEAALPADRATISRDRSILATATPDGRLQLWEFTTGLPTATLGEPRDCGSAVALALSLDNRLAATAWNCGEIGIWDLADGSYRHLASKASADSLELLFSAEGRKLIVSSRHGNDIEAIDLDSRGIAWSAGAKGYWDWSTDPSAEKIYQGGPMELLGDVIVTFGEQQTKGPCSEDEGCSFEALAVLRFHDSVSGDLVDEAQSPLARSARALDVSDSGEVLVTHDLSGLRIWDTIELTASPPFTALPDQIVAWAPAPDGRHVLLNNTRGTVRLLDTTGGTVVESMTLPNGYSWRLWPATPDGREFLVRAVEGLERWSIAGHRVSQIQIGAPDDLDWRGVLAVSAARDQIAVQLTSRQTAIASASTGELAHVFDMPNGNSAAFSPDGSLLAVWEGDDTLRVFDTASGTLQGSHQFEPFSYLMPTFVDGSRILLHAVGRSPIILDLADGTRTPLIALWDAHVPPQIAPSGEYLLWPQDDRHLFVDRRGPDKVTALEGHTDLIVHGQFLRDAEHILTGSTDLTTRIWDTETGAPLLQFIAGDQPEDWLAVTPAGFFNFGGDGMNLLAVVDGLTPYGVEQFYQALYRPDLVQELLRGDPQLRYADAASKLNLRSILESGSLPQIRIITAEQQHDALHLVAEVTDTGGGIGNVSISVRGEDAAKAEQRAFEPGRGEVLAGPRSIRIDRAIPLEPCTEEPCRNVVSIVAFNGANLLASDPVEITVDAIGVTQGRRGTLHVLAIGVDNYAPGGVRPLNYAVADATKVAEALERVGANLYDGVEITTLLDAAVTTENLDRIFTELGNRIEPHDKFVFYVAGHGVTKAGRYYFFPQDFTYDDGGTIEGGAIDQEQWNIWFDRIRARASLFLYDTCEAGSVADANIQRGEAEVEGALNRLINALGRNVIAASSGEQSANEGYNGHGLFTWTLLEAFADGDVDMNAMIEVTELQTYIENRVPILSREHFGIAQQPRYDIRANFPVGAMVAEVAPVAAIPKEFTHIVVQLAEVRDSAGNVLRSLHPGEAVRVTEAGLESSKVAQEGVELGFVDTDALLEIKRN